jgi:hypothetical protein
LTWSFYIGERLVHANGTPFDHVIAGRLQSLADKQDGPLAMIGERGDVIEKNTSLSIRFLFS